MYCTAEQVGKTAILQPCGRNKDRQDSLCGCNENRWAGEAPATTFGRALSKSAGARRLAVFSGQPDHGPMKTEAAMLHADWLDGWSLENWHSE
jgi:hypothetical protein